MRIDAELADVMRLGGFFAIDVGQQSVGWRPIEQCYEEGFGDLIALTLERSRTQDLRVAASLVQFGLASRLWSPAIACAVIHDVVPDLGEVHRAMASAELRLTHPAGTRVDDPERLPELLYQAVVERNLELFAANLKIKLAPGLLHGNAASAMVAATRALYDRRPDVREKATRLARALLDTGKLAATGTVKHNLAFRRRSCCLYYRIADGSKCGDCGLVKTSR